MLRFVASGSVSADVDKTVWPQGKRSKNVMLRTLAPFGDSRTEVGLFLRSPDRLAVQVFVKTCTPRSDGELCPVPSRILVKYARRILTEGL